MRELEAARQAFYDARRSLDMPFVINDFVTIVAGDARGTTGAVISLESVEPEHQYLVELATGADVLVLGSQLRLAD